MAGVLVDTGHDGAAPGGGDLDPASDHERAGLRPHRHRHRSSYTHLTSTTAAATTSRGQADYVPSVGSDDGAARTIHVSRVGRGARQYGTVRVDGELELLPGLRPYRRGPPRGHAVVVVETGGREASSSAGDVAVVRRGSDEPHTEGRCGCAPLDPSWFWLAHEHEPWRPAPSKASARSLA